MMYHDMTHLKRSRIGNVSHRGGKGACMTFLIKEKYVLTVRCGCQHRSATVLSDGLNRSRSVSDVPKLLQKALGFVFVFWFLWGFLPGRKSRHQVSAFCLPWRKNTAGGLPFVTFWFSPSNWDCLVLLELKKVHPTCPLVSGLQCPTQGHLVLVGLLHSYLYCSCHASQARDVYMHKWTRHKLFWAWLQTLLEVLEWERDHLWARCFSGVNQ